MESHSAMRVPPFDPVRREVYGFCSCSIRRYVKVGVVYVFVFAWKCVTVPSRIPLLMRLFFLCCSVSCGIIVCLLGRYTMGHCDWRSNDSLYEPRRDPYVSSAVSLWSFFLVFERSRAGTARTNEQMRTSKSASEVRVEEKREKQQWAKCGRVLIGFVSMCVGSNLVCVLCYYS